MTATAWRKSSWSTFNGSCIEVADWRKSGRCQAGECVEAGTGDAAVGVRDSTDRGGPALTFAPDAWRAFTAALKALPVPVRASAGQSRRGGSGCGSATTAGTCDLYPLR